jgi:hypothetical protein
VEKHPPSSAEKLTLIIIIILLSQSLKKYAIMSDQSVVVKTRKFMKNPLLSRRQVRPGGIDVPRPSVGLLTLGLDRACLMRIIYLSIN